MAEGLNARVQACFPEQVLAARSFRGQETVVVRREGLLTVARLLRDDPDLAFDFLMDLSCVDYLTFGRSASSRPSLATPAPLPYYMTPKPDAEAWERLPAPRPSDAYPPRQAGGVSNAEYRFDVVYHFFSARHGHRLRLRVPVALSDPRVDSLTGLWHAANWFEREVWDMFGIVFTGHPNLKRILMYEGFTGHPLRKDYPFDKRQPLIGPVN